MYDREHSSRDKGSHPLYCHFAEMTDLKLSFPPQEWMFGAKPALAALPREGQKGRHLAYRSPLFAEVEPPMSAGSNCFGCSQQDPLVA